MQRRIVSIVIIATVLLGSLFLFFYLHSKRDVLEVSFLSIGQGDSVLIESPYGQNILIDGGPDNAVIHELGKNLPFYDRTIDLMILTHPHADHVVGLVEVLERYQVKNILYTGASHTSPVYLKWLRLIKEKEIPLKMISGRQRVDLGKDSHLDILWPQEDLLNKKVSNLNNTSIVARLIYGQNTFLFTGDIEKETEESLLGSKIDLRADILKVAHHGSDTSTSKEFIKAVSPEVAVITFGDNNFGFPDQAVVNRLQDNGVKIFDTQKGSIVFLADGILIEKGDR